MPRPAGSEGWTEPGVTQAERAGCPSHSEDERGRSAERREASLGPPERPGEATPSISRREGNGAEAISLRLKSEADPGEEGVLEDTDGKNAEDEQGERQLGHSAVRNRR